MEGNDGDDIIQGDDGVDFIYGGIVSQSIISAPGNSAQADQLYGNDYIYLNNIGRGIDLFRLRTGDDLYITSNGDMNDNGVGDSGVLLLGWYTGSNTIEFLVTADQVAIPF